MGHSSEDCSFENSYAGKASAWQGSTQANPRDNDDPEVVEDKGTNSQSKNEASENKDVPKNEKDCKDDNDAQQTGENGSMEVVHGQDDETVIEKDGDGFNSSLDWDMMTTQELFGDTSDLSDGSD